MSKRNDEHAVQAVYTPDNEPYLGRTSVYHFDQVISSCLEVNQEVAAFTRNANLDRMQTAASQLIPQGINLALTIRELVRQGYLFGAAVLIRPLLERAAIISYLCENPAEVGTWEEGWEYGERPGLATMLSCMRGDDSLDEAKEVTALFGHLVHGDPIGSRWNLIALGDQGLGYAVGKTVDHPELCDFVCYQAQCWLVVLLGRMVECFPGLRET